MTKELIKNYLIYLDLCLMATEQRLNSEGFIAIAELLNKNPEFSRRREMNLKIFEVLDNGKI